MNDKADWTDDLLRDVAQRPAVPDKDFMARLIGDALAVQPAAPAVLSGAPTSRPRRARVSWRWLWPSGGLAAALACGIWLGISPQSFMAPYLHNTDLAVEPYQILDIYAALEVE